MNWRKIHIYAIVVLVAQMTIGFLEGFFSPATTVVSDAEMTGWFTLSNVASLIACAAIFAHMATRQKSRPFLHASLSLVIYIAISLAMYAVVWLFLENLHIVFLFSQWVTLFVATFAGVAIGKTIARKGTV